jgi:glycine oxidase
MSRASRLPDTPPERPYDAEPRYDAVVVGGGVIGLSAAWKLATRALRVALVDPDPCTGASWVAAGMLAPVSEVRFGEEPLLALNLASARRWPAFADELARSVGRPVGYRRCGTLIVAVDDDDRAWAEELFCFQRDLGLEVQWLTGRRGRDMEPAVAPGVRAAISAPHDHQVHNRVLLGALTDAAAGAGVTVHRARALALEQAGGAVSGVGLANGTVLRAGAVVLAAGCWSGELGGVPEGALPSVRPVKGQVLRLLGSDRAPALTRTVRGIVQGASVYLVPRDDGSVVVGATVEELGFDTTVTAGAVYELLRDARRVVPGITEAAVGESSAGLRPCAPDNAPLVGPCGAPGASGLVVATGHYRHGFLLAPLTADAVAAVVTGEEPPAEMAPFGLGRFTSRPASARSPARSPGRSPAPAGP